MRPPTPKSTRTDTLFPYSTLVRSLHSLDEPCRPAAPLQDTFWRNLDRLCAPASVRICLSPAGDWHLADRGDRLARGLFRHRQLLDGVQAAFWHDASLRA